MHGSLQRLSAYVPTLYRLYPLSKDNGCGMYIKGVPVQLSLVSCLLA
jgi:hypothetical protein